MAVKCYFISEYIAFLQRSADSIWALDVFMLEAKTPIYFFSEQAELP